VVYRGHAAFCHAVLGRVVNLQVEDRTPAGEGVRVLVVGCQEVQCSGV